MRTYVKYLITRPRANSIKKLRYLKITQRIIGKTCLKTDSEQDTGSMRAACVARAHAQLRHVRRCSVQHNLVSGIDISASFLKIDFPLLTPKTPCIVLTTGVVVSDVQYGRASIVSKHHTLQDPFVVL